MNTQPAALHYAEVLENFYLGLGRLDATGAAAELRRLHQSCREGWRHADELEQERKRLVAENEALRSSLKKANDQSEHFEREWYLRGDELEVLRADPGNQFAHRLAIELECMMLNPTASYNSAGNLIDEYRTAVHRWNEATGQPYVSGFGKD
jgi:hypothetical protein